MPLETKDIYTIKLNPMKNLTTQTIQTISNVCIIATIILLLCRYLSMYKKIKQILTKWYIILNYRQKFLSLDIILYILGFSYKYFH